MKPILTFDLNGTITDTGALDPLFASAFGSAERRHEWYMQLIELAMACTARGQFIEFSKLSEAAIYMLAERYHVSLTGEQSTASMDRIRSLPPFPEVKGALEKLRANGYRLVVLTNSSLRGGESTLQSGGIAEYFERVLSVEMVKIYKPWPRVYQAAARELGVATSDLMMVAAHNWDTVGAMRAGCRGAFITRPGEVLSPTDPRPEIIARDFLDLAAQLETA